MMSSSRPPGHPARVLTRWLVTSAVRVGCLLALLGSAACAPQPPLRVGANTWPGYEPLYLARSLNYFGDTPIQLVDFSSATEVIRAYRNGLLDVAAITLDEAIVASSGAARNRVVLICDTSLGADAVVAGPGIASLADLRGKRVAAEATATGAYVLARALGKAGLSPGDVRLVQAPVNEHDAVYTAGAADAVVTFEPTLSRLKERGAHVLFDSSQIPGEIVDVLMTRQELPPAHEDALRALATAWYRAVDYLHTYPEDAARVMATREGITPAQYLAAIRHLDFPDRSRTRALLADGPGSLGDTMTRLLDVMRQHRFVITPVAPLRLDASFVGTGAP